MAKLGVWARRYVVLLATIVTPVLLAQIGEAQPGNQEPTADFTISEATQPSSAVFWFNSTSLDPDGSIVNWTWDLGDGNLSYSERVAHRYRYSDLYAVKLTVTDNGGAQASLERIATATNVAPPQADFVLSPRNPGVGENVTFFDNSTDVDSRIVLWEWEFGDGEESNEPNPIHAYAHPGKYTVNLTVRGSYPWGESDTHSILIQVGTGGTEATAGRASTDVGRVAVVAGAGAIVLAAGGIAGFAWFERFRWRWLLAFAPLYTRLARDEILENGMRQAIYGYVEQNPGVHLRGIQHGLQLKYGTLTHHVRMLVKQKYVRQLHDGMFLRYYVIGTPVPADPRDPLAVEVQRFVAAQPGCTNAQVAQALGRRPSLIHYHVERLAAAGKVRKTPDGREVKLHVAGFGA